MSNMEKKQGRKIVEKKSSARKIIHRCFNDGVCFFGRVEKKSLAYMRSKGSTRQVNEN
jgi:hypothetical protein